jgi:hypothetical protein
MDGWERTYAPMSEQLDGLVVLGVVGEVDWALMLCGVVQISSTKKKRVAMKFGEAIFGNLSFKFKLF